MAKKQFKAESKRLMDLMINSIYTHKEIFLREIISNASDAIDKLCYQSLTDENVGLNREDFCIRITLDPDARTITVSDNGIGMTKEDMEKNLGVIAHSGSLQFKKEMDTEKAADEIDIIGQFGVGFYSAFMVADKVTVISKAYGAESACKWESTGTDGYTVSDWEKETVGTDIIMHVKDDEESEKYSIYLTGRKVQELIKKYSDYVRWPIRMLLEKVERVETGETDENGIPKMDTRTTMEEQVVNSMVPIWQRSRGEATDADCMEFYKEKFRDHTDPVSVIRINAEGLTSYKAMLFIPGQAPYDFYSRDFEPGLQLYSSGVMIMEKCADLLPECFRFVRGVVDSPDLSLNISREILQHDRQLKVIAANLEKKIKAELTKLQQNDKEKYETFWQSFGRQLKYGLVDNFGVKRELLQDLILFRSSAGEGWTSLAAYVDRMPESQKCIYYACGENEKRCAGLPQSERVLDSGYEILYMTEEVDEFVAQVLGLYKEKPFCNVTADDLGLETEDEKKETEEKQAAAQGLLDFVKEKLGDEVVDVRLSHKLKSHPVCLTTEGEITLEMERYFKSVPAPEAQNIKARKVLELNGSHTAFAALEKAWTEDPVRAENMARILLNQAKLIAGISLDDPAAYAELVCSLF